MSGASTHEHEGHGHEGHGHEGHGREADGHGGEANGSFDTELNSLEYESVRHDGHIHESHQSPRAGRELWATAVSATLHCLTGCAIGEVLGMILATWWGLSNGLSIALSVVLAFLFGYSLTMAPILRANVPLRRAVAVAFAADTVSIATMEVMDSAFILAVPGAIDAMLLDLLFWWSLAASLVVAFLVTVPVNRALIARGKGHAVVHAYHH
jgi:hypothetical protein